EHRWMDAVMQPGIAQIRTGTECDESPRDPDETGLERVRALPDRREAQIVQRSPAARPAALGGESGVLDKARLDCRGVAEEQGGVDVRARDSRMPREQPLGAIASTIGRRLDEVIHSGAEFERQFLDALAQGIPRVESMFARDH